MALTLQEVSDRMEIQDLMVRYCYAVDDRQYDALDAIFTQDAIIDYGEMVGFKGSLAETKAFLIASLGQVPMAQHAVSTTEYRIDGDSARTRTVCFNPMVVPGDDGSPQTVFFGLWYVHEFCRTSDGWRITHLYEKKAYNHNLPDHIRKLTAA